MPITPNLDTAGGCNFEDYDVRNVGSISTGQSALAEAPYDAEHQRVKINTELNLAGKDISEFIQDLVAAMLASDDGTVTISYDDAAGTINLRAVSSGGFNPVANRLYF